MSFCKGLTSTSQSSSNPVMASIPPPKPEASAPQSSETLSDDNNKKTITNKSHERENDDYRKNNNNNNNNTEEEDDDEDYHAIVRHLRAKRLSRELAEAEVQRELLRRKSTQRGQQMSAVLTVAEQRAKQKVNKAPVEFSRRRRGLTD